MIKFFLCSVLFCFCFSSCSYIKKFFGSKPKATTIKRDFRLAGRIERVELQSNYVLIRRYGAWRFDAAEEIAESRAENRTANLLPTGEKLGEHIAADIRSGDVQVGDAVYIRRIKVSQKTKPFIETEKPILPDNQSKTVENP